MPEITLGAEKAADISIGGRSVPENTVLIGTEDKEVAGLNVPEEQDQQAEGAESTGAAEEAPAEAEADGQKEAPATDGAFIVAGKDMSAYADEYAKEGKLSGDSYKALEAAGFPRDMVDAYIRGVESAAESAGALAQKEVTAILESVGGEERYNQVMAWAARRMSTEEKAAYDKAVTGSDPATARLVVQGLMARYERERGNPPPSLVMGSRAPSEAASGYKDRSSMIKAMNDPRYGTDPDYTREVERKTIASGLMRSGRR